MEKVFVGQRVAKLETGRTPEAVSRVVLAVDGENVYTAGDDTGRCVEKTVPWASQAMAEQVLARLRGVVYRPFTGTDAVLDPAAEVGDGVTVGGVYSVLARADVTFDGLYSSDIAAPGGDEVEDEYPYQSKARRQSQRELAKIRSSITKTAERITLLVENEVEGLEGKLELTASSLTTQISNTRAGLESKIAQTASEIAARVSTAEGNIGSLQLTASSLSSSISNAQGNISRIDQRVDSIGFSVSGSSLVLTKDGVSVSHELQAASLRGDVIYVNDGRGGTAATITATSASSYTGQKFYLSSGAVELRAHSGDVYLSAQDGSLQVGGGQIAVGGDCVPYSDNWFSLGRGGLRWTDVYASNGTIVTSDREKKKDIAYGLERYGALFDALRPVSYRLRDGESGRTHLGLIAQDVEKALADCGLTDMDFAGFIRSPREGGGFDYALRYGEIIAMLIFEVQKLKKGGLGSE